MGRARHGRGFILAAAISIVFVMVIVAMTISSKNRVLQGRTMDAETEARETEGVGYALAQIRGVMQGNGTPDIFRIPAPPPNDATVFTGTTPDQLVSLDGNLTVAPHKQGEANGYGASIGAAGCSSLNVPTCHSAVVVTAGIRDDNTKPRQRYASVSTGCYPYGLVALAGFLNVKSARSVGNYSTDPNNPESNISPLMVRVYAGSFFNITDSLNGRACTPAGPTPSSHVGSGGAVSYNCTRMTLPPDFMSQLPGFKSQAVTGNTNSLQLAFQSLHNALHHNFSAAYGAALAAQSGAAVVDNPAHGANYTDRPTFDSHGTDYDNTGKLTINDSLFIPSFQAQELTFSNVVITGDLLLVDQSVLHLTGPNGSNLQVNGTIRLGRSATLVVDGATNATALSLTYNTTADQVDITSVLYSKGTTTLLNGMSQTPVNGWTADAPTPLNNPYPATLYPQYPSNTGLTTVPQSNALASAYDVALVADTAALNSPILGGVAPCTLGNYLVTLNLGTANTTEVPGAFVLTDSNLNIIGGDKAAGLLVASAGVSLGVKQMVGCVWSSTDINAPITDYRYFPYYQHFLGRAAAGNVMVSAVEQHPIAYGKLQLADGGVAAAPVNTTRGGGCFIATAAYGSYLDPHVVSLRQFRDHWLLTNRPGQALVEVYYRLSPPVAEVIAASPCLRCLTRAALTPAVGAVEYPWATLAISSGLLGLLWRRRRLAKQLGAGQESRP